MLASGTRVVNMLFGHTRMLRGVRGREWRQTRPIRRAAKGDDWGDWGTSLAGSYGAGIAAVVPAMTARVLDHCSVRGN